MSIVLKVISQNKLSSLIITVFILITAIISLLLPQLLAYIISQVIPQELTLQLIIICFIMSLLVLIEILLSKNVYMLVTMIQSSVVSKLKLEFIKSVIETKMYNRVETMESINQINQVGGIISYPVVKLSWQLLVASGSLIYLFMVDAKIALILVLLIPSSYRISSRLKRTEIEDAASIGESRKRINDKVNELFKNADLYKVNLNHDYQLEKFATNVETITVKQIEESSPQISNIAFFSMIPILGYLLFGLGAIRGNVTFGQYVAIIQYVTFVYAPIRLFTANQCTIATALSSYQQIRDQIKQNKKSGKVRQVSFDRIETIQFAKPKYKQRVSIDLNQTLRAGKVFNIKCPTGSGKTTIMRMLMKLQPIDDGAILINNIDIKQVKERFLWNHIYYANQDINGFSGTIIDNILIGSNATSKDIRFYIKKYQLEKLTKDLKWRKKISNFEQLTLEERKQIQIFKLLLAKKDVYVLDELESSLDAEWITKLDRIVEDKAKQAIVIRIIDQPTSID